MRPLPEIVSKGGTARGFVPLYSLDQTVFTVALAAACFGLLRMIDPSSAAGATLAGVLGASLVAYSGRPAYLLLPDSQMDALPPTLEALGYRYEAATDRWVPDLPRWLRWSYNFVRVEHHAGGRRLYGPAYQLRAIAERV